MRASPRGVVVAVIDKRRPIARRVGLAGMLLLAGTAIAAVLPDDRSDLMYHAYDGGGVSITGPALLLRKSVGQNVSISGSHYVDSISSASIDVISNASPYDEERTENSVGVDVLHADTTMNLSFTTSDESDYQAESVNFSLSQDVFGGLTTVTMGLGVGNDEVGRVDTDFSDSIKRYNYHVGWSQVWTKTLISSLDYEAILDEGYLNNPYRSARVLGASVPEIYPRTRSSHALSLKSLKYWPNQQAASRIDYRYFWDTWDITAHTLEFGYSFDIRTSLRANAHYRYYTQQAASFYSDNFDQVLTYMARDKELSTFVSHTLGAGIELTLFERPWYGLEHGSASLVYEYIQYDYDDFSNPTTNQAYSFSANVLQLMLSAWF